MRTLLTYEEMVAGQPCPGCGKPLLGQPGEWIAPLQKRNGAFVSVEETELAEAYAQQEQEKASFKAEHADCTSPESALRFWGVSGHLGTHCRACCGFGPPWSPELKEKIHALLNRPSHHPPPPPPLTSEERRQRRIERLNVEARKLGLTIVDDATGELLR